MSYVAGIRTDLPAVRWNRHECIVCKEQVWVPGPRTDDNAACSDHDGVAVIGNLTTYLESITSPQ